MLDRELHYRAWLLQASLISGAFSVMASMISRLDSSGDKPDVFTTSAPRGTISGAVDRWLSL
jgi:hypothetical protein